MDDRSSDGVLPPPLAGIRVLDLTHLMAGPLTTMLLSDMGAEVIKIEPPGTGDGMRNNGFHFRAGQAVSFLGLNRGKKSVTLNVTKPLGREILLKLAKTCDVVVENFRPGTVERLGIGYDVLREINPRVIYCSTCAFGRGPAYRDKPGVDTTLQAYAGLMSMNGEPDRPPALIGSPICDFSGGMVTLQAILFALIARERYGVGQRVDVSMFDAALYAMVPREQEYFATGQPLGRLGSSHRHYAPQRSYATKNGYVYLAIYNEPNWQRLCGCSGFDVLAGDARFSMNVDRLQHRQVLDAIVQSIFAERTTEELMAIFEAADVMASPVRDIGEVYADPLVAENEMIHTVLHPTVGEMKMVGIPYKLSKTPGAIQSPPPLLGEHTEEVLATLGYSREGLAQLREDGVIG